MFNKLENPVKYLYYTCKNYLDNTKKKHCRPYNVVHNYKCLIRNIFMAVMDF